MSEFIASEINVDGRGPLAVQPVEGEGSAESALHKDVGLRIRPRSIGGDRALPRGLYIERDKRRGKNWIVGKVVRDGRRERERFPATPSGERAARDHRKGVTAVSKKPSEQRPVATPTIDATPITAEPRKAKAPKSRKPRRTAEPAIGARGDKVLVTTETEKIGGRDEPFVSLAPAPAPTWDARPVRVPRPHGRPGAVRAERGAQERLRFVMQGGSEDARRGAREESRGRKVRTFTRRPARPATPRDRLAQRLWDQAAKNYAAIGATYRADVDGAPVLIEESDRDLRAAGLEGRLQDSLPESVWYDADSRSFVALVIYTNDGGPQFIVPDEPWVDRFEPGLQLFLRRESVSDDR